MPSVNPPNVYSGGNDPVAGSASVSESIGMVEALVPPIVTVLGSPAMTRNGSKVFVASTCTSLTRIVKSSDASAVAVSSPSATVDETSFITTVPSACSAASSVSSKSRPIEPLAPAGMSPMNVTRAPSTSSGSTPAGSTPPGASTHAPSTNTS